MKRQLPRPVTRLGMSCRATGHGVAFRNDANLLPGHLRFARHSPRLPILLASESREDERERRGNRGSAANGPSSPFFVKGAMVKPRSHSSVSSSATHSTNHVRLLILIGLIEGIDS